MQITTAHADRPNFRIYDYTGGGVTEDIQAASLEDAIEAGKKWIEEGSWESSEDGVYRTINLDCRVGQIIYAGDEIDEDATAAEHRHHCDGSHTESLPKCEASDYPGETDAEGHDWVSVTQMGQEWGTYSNGGTAFTHHEVCRGCGKYKITSDPGSQRNSDEALEIIKIRDRDEESEAWLKEIHEEDGWLPQWLAEYLDCLPTVRMTKEEAEEWRDEHSDDDEMDRETLEHAYGAIIGARPSSDDDTGELWSSIF